MYNQLYTIYIYIHYIYNYIYMYLQIFTEKHIVPLRQNQTMLGHVYNVKVLPLRSTSFATTHSVLEHLTAGPPDYPSNNW